MTVKNYRYHLARLKNNKVSNKQHMLSVSKFVKLGWR